MVGIASIQRIIIILFSGLLLIFGMSSAWAKALPVRVAGSTFVMPINKPPTTSDDTFHVNEYSGICDENRIDESSFRCNYVIDTLSNDADFEGDDLTLHSVSVAQSGMVTISDNKAVYLPTTSFFKVGSDSFTYEAIDSKGNTSKGTVSLILNRAPIVKFDGFDIPIINSGSFICNATSVDAENCHFVVDPLANDPGDPEGDAIAQIITTRNRFWGYDDILIYTPANGRDDATEDNMKIDFHITSTCFYGTEIPGGCDYDKVGAADSSYRVVDARGAISKIAFVNYAPDNHPPVADDDSGYLVAKNSSITINVLANDYDEDGHTFELRSIQTPPLNGTAAVSGNQVVYTPDTGFVGKDYFDYKIVDSLGAPGYGRVSVEVYVPNTPPDAMDDSAQANANSFVFIDVLSNDSDADGDPINLSGFVSLPTNGTVSTVSGQVKYIPNTNFYGSDQFKYRIADSKGAIDTANVTVQVLATPFASITSPSANDKFSLAQSVVAQATASDLDGTVVSVKFKLAGSATWFTDTTVPYSHDFGALAVGTHTIEVMSTDNSGFTSSISSVDIEVLPSVTVDANWTPDAVYVNDAASLTWSSSGATECSSVEVPEVTGTSGTINGLTFATAGVQNVTVTCSNSATSESNNDVAVLTVSDIPLVEVTASWTPNIVPAGGASTLTWSSTNATECSSSELPEVTGTSGTVIDHRFYTIGIQTTTITCTNSATSQSGSADASVTVEKLPAPQNVTTDL